MLVAVLTDVPFAKHSCRVSAQFELLSNDRAIERQIGNVVDWTKRPLAPVKPVYDAYHAALTDYCRDVQQKFHMGLLLDIHGQATAEDTVFRGTQDGKTVTLLRERFGEAARTGQESQDRRLRRPRDN